MFTVFHFNFCYFKVTDMRDHANISVAQKEQSHPILKYREAVMKKLVFSLTPNDENHFLKWTWKRCFIGVHNNSKAIVIKKMLGLFFFFWKEPVVLFSWNCGHAASILCHVGS